MSKGARGKGVGARSRGPYKRPAGASTYEQRVADYAAPPIVCACGCGIQTEWDRSRRRWKRYVSGHYRAWSPYKDIAWLKAQYVDLRRTAAEIAAECGVGPTVISRALHRAGIPVRDRSDSRRGRKVGAKNPAWKGGVSVFPYSPDWADIANRVRQEAGWACEWCGLVKAHWGRSLHVHHIDGDKRNNSRDNLVALCASCHHGKAHGRKGVSKQLVQAEEAS